MAAFKNLEEDKRQTRRTLADAFDVIERACNVKETPAEVKILELRLATGQIVGAAVSVWFSELQSVVAMPVALEFRAVRIGGDARETFAISRLHGAHWSGRGPVRLADGTEVNALELIKTPLNHSDLEVAIVREVLGFLKEPEAYRNLMDDMPSEHKEQLPDLYVVDYSRLPGLGLHVGLLPPIQKRLASSGLNASLPTIASALKRAGISYGPIKVPA